MYSYIHVTSTCTHTRSLPAPQCGTGQSERFISMPPIYRPGMYRPDRWYKISTSSFDASPTPHHTHTHTHTGIFMHTRNQYPHTHTHTHSLPAPQCGTGQWKMFISMPPIYRPGLYRPDRWYKTSILCVDAPNPHPSSPPPTHTL